MADVPVPGAELTPDAIAAAVPNHVHELLRTLWAAGHAAYVVGGSIRDTLLGIRETDWDLATSALPEATVALLPGIAVYENRFGTVAVRPPGHDVVEVTTFRSDHDYADFRRPHRVEFSDSIDLDLARRDFTVNAMAWGAEATDAGAPRLVDPHAGLVDLRDRTLRAVGDPVTRFDEDALRMLRAVRLAAQLDFVIDDATFDAIRSRSGNLAHISGERIATELARILDADRPSVGLRQLQDSGLLASISPELALQRGMPQNKVPGEDLWDHTVRAVDGATRRPTYIRMAALLHDIGKPATMAEGRFLRHDLIGAEMAGELLDRLRWPRAEREHIVHLVRNHMYGYEPTWSDAAVRRFIAKIGRDELVDLFMLREADNVGSGRPRDGGGLQEIRRRVAEQLAADVVIDLPGLALDGDDLMDELSLSPGPQVGRILAELLDRVIADPSLNRRPTLLAIARSMAAEAAS